MSVTYGFYNSLNGDRAYDARDISNMFNGIIADGVLATVGDGLIVKQTATPSMDILVSSGRAWFDGTWTYNDADMALTIEESDLVLDRIDLIVLEVNTDVSVRANEIKVITGVPASTPVAETLIQTETLNQYPLAEIYISAGVTDVIDANITNKVGTVDCPFVTGLIDTIDADALLLQWDSEFNAWMAGEQVDFDTWFQTVQDALDGDTAGNLLNLIQSNATKIIESASIISASWTDDTATSGYWIYDYTNANIDTDTVVDVNIALSDLENASVLKPVTQSFSGYARLYADEQPAVDLTADIIIKKVVV